MPAIDQCEPQVVRAFEKAGWVITDEQFPIYVSKREFVFADLRIQHVAESQTILVVEVKCFSSKRSLLDEFYHAVGQYAVYRNALRLAGINVNLYLSVPSHIYDTFFDRAMVNETIKDVRIKMVVVDLEREEIVSWIS